MGYCRRKVEPIIRARPAFAADLTFRPSTVPEELKHFTLEQGCGAFRPTGEVGLDEAVRLVTAAIKLTREQKIRKLMVVTSGLTGFASPSLSARYFFINEWAQAAGGFVRIAVVARPEMIDPNRFGIMVAANRGLKAEVFVAEEAAMAWLQGSGTA